MRKIIRLTESDLARIVKRVIKEQEEVLYGPDGKVEDFCKVERKTLQELLNNSEIPSECLSNDDENACGYASGKIAYKINMSGQSTKLINLNSVRHAGDALSKCYKENEPERGPQVSKPKNPLEIGSKEPETFG
jgi:hypothetical protein